MKHLWIIIISTCVIILGGSLLLYLYRSQPIPLHERANYLNYMMIEYFEKNQSGFNSIQISHYEYFDPINSTIGVYAMGQHKFNDCNMIYQDKADNKTLYNYANITNRGEAFYDDPTRVQNATNRMIFECKNPAYSLAWPYMTFNGIIIPGNMVSVKAKFESQSNITLSIYSCMILKCESEHQHLVVEKQIMSNKNGDFTYLFKIPQTNDNLLYVDVKSGNKEYILGSKIGS